MIPNLSEADIAAVLGYEQLIPAMEKALSAFSAGQVIQPVRNMLTIEEAKRTLDLLARISEGIRDLPALLLVTARVDADPLGLRWLPSPPLLTLDIGVLSTADATDLARCYDGINAASADACVSRVVEGGQSPRREKMKGRLQRPPARSFAPHAFKGSPTNSMP